MVNGARIDDSIVLRDGDEIQIGSTQLKFEQEEVRAAFKPTQTSGSESVAAAYLIDPDGKQHYLGSHTEIGSALTADLAFHDRGLCTRHARIVCEGGEAYYLIPLTADQKTEHNGRTIQQGARALLSSGDCITLGGLDLGFRRAG
jgi:pSer/pThr/pTyr-binding forkhead associated (FHA) protein